jgi:hypothetical protein
MKARNIIPAEALNHAESLNHEPPILLNFSLRAVSRRMKGYSPRNCKEKWL